MTGHHERPTKRLTNEELLETAHGFEPAPYREALGIEISATRDLYAAAPADVAVRLGIEVHSVGQSTLFVAVGLPQLMFNRVELSALDSQISPEELATSLSLFADRGVTSFIVQVDATASGEHAQAVMAAHRLVPFRRPWLKLVRASAPLPRVESEFEVIEATPSQANIVATLMVQGFGLPAAAVELYRSVVGRRGWHAYLALDPTAGTSAGGVAAMGLAFIEGTLCYLAGGVTLPEYRGRKAQRLLMHRRIEDAVQAGATTITTETGLPLASEENPSYRNMIHLGFRAVGTRDNYAPAGTRW